MNCYAIGATVAMVADGAILGTMVIAAAKTPLEIIAVVYGYILIAI